VVLPQQIKLITDGVYWKKVYQYDVVFGKNATAERPRGFPERFWNIAFLLVRRTLAESDLEDWKARVPDLARAITDS
jgi:hypothetical protein